MREVKGGTGALVKKMNAQIGRPNGRNVSPPVDDYDDDDVGFLLVIFLVENFLLCLIIYCRDDRIDQM